MTRLLRDAGFSVIRRQNFHHWDFTYDIYSVFGRLGLNRHLGAKTFSTDYKNASLAARIAFLALAGSASILCLPYSVVSTWATGRGATLTVTARKAPPEPIKMDD